MSRRGRETDTKTKQPNKKTKQTDKKKQKTNKAKEQKTHDQYQQPSLSLHLSPSLSIPPISLPTPLTVVNIYYLSSNEHINHTKR